MTWPRGTQYCSDKSKLKYLGVDFPYFMFRDFRDKKDEALQNRYFDSMEGISDDKLNGIVDIFPDGDVILIVGSDKVKLRVHSVFLRTASKTFSAMFNPLWKEGDSLGQEGPLELPLPDDDASALQMICNLIHHQDKFVPQSLAPSEILKIAITADKYHCVAVLKFATTAWLQPLDMSADSLILLTTAAYVLQHAPAFKRITKSLIVNHGGTFLTLTGEHVLSILPWLVFCGYLDDRHEVGAKSD